MINDQAQSVPPVRDEAPSVTGSDVGRIVAGLLVLVFAGVTGLFAPLMVMASDSCSEGDARMICSAGTQQIVGGLPVGAAFVAALLAVVGMSSRHAGAVGCLLAAPGLLVLSWVVSLALAGS
ncbi:hypothetical protein CP981_15975 [Streptomyces platensis]|uniref:Uncharacterized protein n=1 Tax=Streptomyces platensis TaxID=58346 RepID=A0AAE6NH74_STRPT|nr:hypothetical protein [Streptomyces platensis]OSY42255.1 hypothetical protein BG653_04826 [Streptomyces platensis]QEV52964.1 hypothetical protein CP981_15975 [Streptomyces platensis]